MTRIVAKHLCALDFGAMNQATDQRAVGGRGVGRRVCLSPCADPYRRRGGSVGARAARAASRDCRGAGATLYRFARHASGRSGRALLPWRGLDVCTRVCPARRRTGPSPICAARPSPNSTARSKRPGAWGKHHHSRSIGHAGMPTNCSAILQGRSKTIHRRSRGAPRQIARSSGTTPHREEIFTNGDCFFPERCGACSYTTYRGIQEGGIQ